MSREPQYLVALTSLRGVFALLVVIYHYTKLVVPNWTPSESGLIGRGYARGGFLFCTERLHHDARIWPLLSDRSHAR